MRREGLMLAVCAVLIVGVFLWLNSWKNGTAVKPHSLVINVGEEADTVRTFTWQSGGKLNRSLVQYIEGNSRDVDWSSAQARTIEGTSNRIKIDGDARTVHKVTITGLQRSQTYAYRIGDGTKKGWSATGIFYTYSPDDSGDGFTFINVTDSQGKTEADFKLWGDTLKQAFSYVPEAAFIVHNGDLTENPKDSKVWDAFFREAALWLSSVPLMPVTGNHEEVEDDAEPFVSLFNVPKNGAKGSINGTTYYFDYDNARFIMLNTESNISGQTKWLEDVLAKNTRKWVIISLHRGPYGGNQNKNIGDWVELFDRYEVDLVLQGHNHEYARSYPLRAGKIAPGNDSHVLDRAGTVYVVTNAAGQKLNEKKKDQFYHKAHLQNGKRMFAAIRISGNILRYEAYDTDGKLWDEFVLEHTLP
ncbi:purple acid phosphatase family protein [Paenibacillus paeoniae]|uniref:Metallophosphoesterase n=1 Tax=Paenibacillus paeoniae TaxID=2292705 RepID=A0A371PIF0_9BACL|nr:metallophosphoesterase family protein [Paenibacillus paeoniae]REK76002.1 metallophosphoesterase [Paenibacillus paeoniae]